MYPESTVEMTCRQCHNRQDGFMTEKITCASDTLKFEMVIHIAHCDICGAFEWTTPGIEELIEEG